jgi:hypothetical protein
LKVRLFEIEVTAEGDGLDVSSEARADAVGFPWERLRSSDVRRADRYRECRVLAGDVVDEHGVSIRYQSVAYQGTENVVIFGVRGARWAVRLKQQVDVLPFVDPASVLALPAGADP